MSMPGPDSAFADCLAVAGRRAAELAAAGRPAVVATGWFRPATDPATWDPRWAAMAARYPAARERGFIHYWVECDGEIIDGATAQYGGPAGDVHTPISDPRYRRTTILR